MLWAIHLIAWIAVLAGVGAPAAQAERRLALSVGIDVYDNLPALEQLQKAVNDARALAAVLRELGFATAVEENLAQVPFARAWLRFLNRLEPGEAARRPLKGASGGECKFCIQQADGALRGVRPRARYCGAASMSVAARNIASP